MRFRKATWFNSLAFKILLAYVAGALLSIALLVLGNAIVRDRLPGMDLGDRALVLAEALRFDSNGQPVGVVSDDANSFWIYDSLGQETAYRVLDGNGKVVLMSSGARAWPDNEDMARLARHSFQFTLEGEPYHGATVPFVKDGTTWFIQLTASSRIVEFLHREFALPFIQLGIIVFSFLLLFVFGLCAYVSLKYSLRPLREASAAAAAISPRSLDERLRMDGMPSEIIPLIDSFNHALERIEKGFRIQQEFLAKAAHELKTPLTLLRTELELMDDDTGMCPSLLAYVEHLSRQVQQLLLLAEASEAASYQFIEVDVHEAVRDAVSFLQRLADDADVRLTIVAAHEGIRWQADRGAFFTLLKNLIENAIQHAPRGTEVRTEIGMDSIRVRDWGAGVKPEQLPLLFSRFWRGAHRRDHGAGLGLAICREIAWAHGWQLSASNAAPGLVMEIVRNGHSAAAASLTHNISVGRE